MTIIAVIDTTFSRVDMGTIVVGRIEEMSSPGQVGIVRRTVPGFKDLAAASRRAIDDGADLVVACAMPGPEPIDESCAKDASFGLQMVQALTGVSVLEVFVHMSEACDEEGNVIEAELAEICVNRCIGHGESAVWMAIDPARMVERAGTGRRQGASDEGTLANPA